MNLRSRGPVWLPMVVLVMICGLSLWACGGGASQGDPDGADARDAGGDDGGGGGDDGGGYPDGGDTRPEEEPIPGPAILLESARRTDQASYLAAGSVAPGPEGSPIRLATISLNDAEPVALSLDQGVFEIPLELSAGVNSVAIAAEDEAGVQQRVAFPVFFRTGLSSSRELIDAAEAAGTLTAEEALSYRVFAAFRDSRLPAEYQGDDTQGYNGDAIDDLIEALPTLSEAAKDTLGPFLAPLFYQDPPRPGPRPPIPMAMPCNPLRATSCPVDSGWEYVDGSTIRVWFDTDNAARYRPMAQAILQTLENPGNASVKLIALMGKQPLSDGGGYFDGGDGRLDIIVAATGTPGMTIPSNALTRKQTSVFITLNAAIGLDGLLSNAVHEYMHAIQYGTPLAGASVPTDYPTLSEALAVWASHYTLSPKNLFHHQANPYLLQATGAGLLSVASEGLPYGAWLFILYLEKTISPNVVRQLWDATATKTERNVFIDVLRGYGTLEVLWPKFAVSMWNREPVKDLRNWDKITEGADPVGGQSYSAILGGVGLDKTDVPAGLPFLASGYKHIVFPDPTVRSAVVLNGMTYRLSTETPSSIDVGGPALYTADAARVKGAALWAVAKINGSWRQPEDWTTLAGGSGREGYRMYCRERDDEKIEELVLIPSFADTTRPDQTYQPQGDPARLVYSNVFCDKASGNANFTWQDPDGTYQRRFATVSDFSWERSDEFVLPGSGDGTVVYGWLLEVKSGSVRHDALGAHGDCTYSGDETKSITAGSEATMLAVLPFCTTVPRAYAFTGFVDDAMKFKVTETCTDPITGDQTITDIEFDAYTEWGFETILIPVFTPANEWETKWTVKPDGRSLEGDAEHLWFPDNVTGSWRVNSTAQ